MRLGRWLTILAAILALLACAPASFGQASQERVLILGTTVTGGAASIEATSAASLGFAVDIVTPAQWATLTASDFARYRAIILGDPTCQVGTAAIAAAEANAGVWGPVVTGNVVLIGTDPVFHAQFAGTREAATRLTQNAVAHATALSGLTGAYVSLSCYYFDSPPGTPVPVLEGFGDFTVESGQEADAVRIVDASSPVLVGLTDVSLSNWGASVHEVFDTSPSGFRQLVVVAGPTGKPYILSRGPTLPTSKEQCQNGGWRNYGSTFKNQGQCVAFVERGPKP
jgi:hypothetical protein